MKPGRTFLFVATVFLLLLVIGWLFPKGGIPLAEDLTLRFAQPGSFFSRDTVTYSDVSGLLAMSSVTEDPEEFLTGEQIAGAGIPGEMQPGAMQPGAVQPGTIQPGAIHPGTVQPDAVRSAGVLPDSAFAAAVLPGILLTGADTFRTVNTDSLVRAHIDSVKEHIHEIECSPDGRELLTHFFQRAEAARSDSIPLRVLHYGDSQIENDRMTALIRYRLQRVFGGSGCGMVPAIPLYSGNPTFVESYTGDWQRYTGFGRRDSTLDHDRYGSMVCFTSVPTGRQEHWPSLEFAFRAGRRASRFERIRLFLHAYADTNALVFTVNDSLSDTIRFVPGGYRAVDYPVPVKADKVEIAMGLRKGGRVYGISFDPEQGLQVDNMAMRGSSGLEFTRTDSVLFMKMTRAINPGLILMQFGGNVVPYIENADYYSDTFLRELKHLKELFPDVPVIVLGPSDMSRKQGGRYVTWETLEPVRDALRKAALEAGFAFWDLYRAMGGKNSMPSFVMADPPLATSDYIHFTARGANLVAEMFYKALMLEYERYRVLAAAGHTK